MSEAVGCFAAVRIASPWHYEHGLAARTDIYREASVAPNIVGISHGKTCFGCGLAASLVNMHRAWFNGVNGTFKS